MTEIKKQIADALCAAAGGALDAETLCAAFEYPPSADMGDLAQSWRRALHARRWRAWRLPAAISTSS